MNRIHSEAATRRRIVEGAAVEIRAHGAVATTLDDIRARTGTSMSQLFHYFPDGKDELLLAVARYEADRAIEDQQPQLGDHSTWAARQSWRDTVVARYRAQGEHCPLDRNTPGARGVVIGLMDCWQAEIAAGIRLTQSSGDVRADLDADRTPTGQPPP